MNVRNALVPWFAVLCMAPLSLAEPRIPSVSELPASSGRFTVAEAYEAVPHRRTVFRFDASRIAEPDRSYLRLMFALIDLGVVARVSAYQSFYYGRADAREALRGISELARFAESEITPPPGLETYHGQIVAALSAQEAFFEEWALEGAGFRSREASELARHPLVQRSSQALRAAYGILMSRYGGGEDQENRNAFFDYHCALDFL